MGSSGQNLYSTPVFELFRRGLSVQTIHNFRGINAFRSATSLTPDWAQDLQNVMVPGWGGLSKFRIPVAMSPAIGGQANGPQSVWDFQQANGTRQVVANFGISLYYFTWDAAGVNLVAPTLIETGPQDAGPWSMAAANNILFGVNGIRAMKWTGVAFQNDGIQVPTQPGGPQFLANQVGGLTAALGGWSWRYAYKNSVTGHVGAASQPSVTTGNGGPFKFTLVATAPNPADAQIDTLVWFRTFDGGGNWYRTAEVTIATGQVTFNAGTFTVLGPGVQSFTVTDNTPDASLDQATQAPLLNLPPVSGGKYMAVGQSRVFIANLPSSPQDVIYSGYEQILLGRPEESYPPGNRLRLSIGAESVAGIGVMQSGVVAFSNTKRMYALRGQVEDISVLAPVGFSAYLEELPYDTGTLCHQSIQSTPYGLLFWATDRTVQMLDNTFALKDMSGPVYPVLRRATKGREAFASSAYFNWLEREWYGLTLAVDGSIYNNLIIFWGLNKDVGQMDIFLATIQADYLTVLSTPQAQRILAAAMGGLINNVPVSQDTTNGVADLSIIPATAGVLPAFWRGGYFGNDAPYRSKMYRRGLLVTDQDGFKVTKRFVDNREFPITAPDVYGPDETFDGGSFELNRRATRCSVEINFPQQDVSANVLELSVGAVATSDRL